MHIVARYNRDLPRSGLPTSDASQEILHWQRRTMEAMYSTIAKTLADANIDGYLPTDFLMFFCLAKRESPEDVDKGLTPAPRGSHAEVLHCLQINSLFPQTGIEITQQRQ